MKIFILSITFLFSANLLWASDIEANDSTMIKALYTKAWNLKFTQTDSAEQIAKQAIDMASKNQELMLEGYCYKTLGVIYAIQGKTDDAIINLTKSYNAFYDIDDKFSMAQINMIISTVYRDKGEYQKALTGFSESLNYSIAENDQSLIAAVYNNIANVFLNLSQFDTAIVCFTKANKIYIELHDSLGIAVTLLNIGNIYFDLKAYKDANEKYAEALPIFENLNSKVHAYMIINNMASICKEQKNYNDAYILNYRALNIGNELNNERGLGNTYDNLAQVHQANGITDSAYFYYQKSIQSRNKSGDNEGLSGVYFNVAMLNFELKDYEKAISNANKSINLAQQNGSIENQKNAFGILYKIYYEQKEYKKAYDANEKYLVLNDSIYNVRITKDVNNINIRYQTEQKQQQIELQNFQLKNQELTIQKTKQKTIYSIIIACIILVSVFVVFLSYHKRKKQQVKLLILKEQIADEQYQNLFQESQLQAIREKITGQEEERTRIARELHDGIGGTLAAVKMRMEHAITKPNPEDMASLAKIVNNTWEEVRTISHNLMPPQFTDVSLDQVLQNHIKELNKPGKINFTLQFLPQTGWNVVPAELQVELYRMVQELCTNIVKYSNATLVELQLTKTETEISFTMEDNGAPFDYRGNGIGHRNLQERLKLFNGSFEKSGGNNGGNTYLVQIPLSRINV
jgi:signal transduction histidine kinase